MKTQSAKAKGRRLQQWFRDLLIDKLGIHKEDIESRSMGAGGEDLIMARSARQKFPYSIECKNQEKINIWESYKQAPYKDCDEKEYQLVLDKMPKNVDWGKLSEYEQMDMTIGSQELACAAGNCEIQ